MQLRLLLLDTGPLMRAWDDACDSLGAFLENIGKKINDYGTAHAFFINQMSRLAFNDPTTCWFSKYTYCI